VIAVAMSMDIGPKINKPSTEKHEQHWLRIIPLRARLFLSVIIIGAYLWLVVDYYVTVMELLDSGEFPKPLVLFVHMMSDMSYYFVSKELYLMVIRGQL
jgi:hypothetical protein